jgi:hypothetical protein
VAYHLLQKIIDTPGIPVMQKAVLVVLARHSLEDGTNKKSPSVQTMGDKAGMCAKAARVALRGLEEDGWIIALGKKSGGRKITTHYMIVAGRFEPEKTRNDSPPFDEETRSHVPSNGHDPAGERRYDSPLNTVPRTAEEVLEEKVSKGSLCESLESAPCAPVREAAHTQGAPVSSETKSAAGSNVVPFVPPGSREALPVGWVLPDEWRAWAQEAGQSGIDSAARRFAMHWRGRGVKSAAEWREAWEVWVTENIERGYGNGAGRNTDQRRGHGDLAAVVKSDLPGWFGYAEGGSNPW